MFTSIKEYQFLFEELVKRDFKKKYKRTILGMLWSILSPLMMLVILALIFGNFFSHNTEHYIIYLFTGQIVFNYYVESTIEGMNSLSSNAHIFSKINIPKYLFLLSKNISSFINFFLILIIYFIFLIIDDISFNWSFILLFYPITCLILMNIGIGLILSALFIFFKDIEYIYRLFTQIVMYGSAIFYNTDILPPYIQNLFLLNPLYVCIKYIRTVVIQNTIPDIFIHLLLLIYSVILLTVGILIYKKYNYKFIYYI